MTGKKIINVRIRVVEIKRGRVKMMMRYMMWRWWQDTE